MGVSKVNFGGDTLIDLTNDSVDAASLLKGKTAHNAALFCTKAITQN